MMVVQCPGCSKRYRFDPDKLQGRPSADLRCPTCQATITISAPDPGDRTMRLPADADLVPKSAPVRSGELAMPAGQRLSLAVLEGKDSGRIFPIEKPQVTLGRGEADIVLNDGEVSRVHACIEVRGPRVVVKDLGSTNGTFLDDVKIAQSEITNRSEFRIGGTRLMLIVTRTEPELEAVE